MAEYEMPAEVASPSGGLGGGTELSSGPTHPELVNIAEEMDEEELRAIGNLCMREYEMDEESRAEWLEKHAQWMKIYHQADKPVNGPWEGSSDDSLPILVEACNQFHARAFQAFFPHRGQIVKATPTGQTDEMSEMRADRVGKHMSWQLTVKDRDYRSRKDALLMQVPLHGSAFTKTWYDPIAGRNVNENVRAEDFVVPYGNGPRELADIERTTEIMWLSVETTNRLASTGYFLGPCVKYMGGDPSPMQQLRDEVEGTQAPYEEGEAKVLEQHRLLDLDGDGVAEPYIVWLDAQTHEVKRITVRYDTADDGTPAAGKTPILYYTHWQFMPNPDGFYGLGMGHLLAKANAAVNKLLRQTIDAGTLANSNTGFISEAAGIRGGEIRLTMGEYMKVPGLEDLARGIMPLRFDGPNPALFQALGLIAQRADRLASVTEALTGETNKVHQPTAILALIDQGLQVYSAIYERLLAAWERELDLIYRLNAKHTPPQEYFAVLDLEASPQAMMIRQIDYAHDMQIKPIADPKMSTEQKRIARAEALYQFALQNPLILNNPKAFWEVSRRYLEAIEIQGIERVLPPPEETEPPRIDDPKEENFYALLPVPRVPPVHPEQNHLVHIREHEALLNDPQYGDKLTPEGKAQLQAHTQTHVAMIYAQTETDMFENDEAEQGRGGGMAPEPGLGMVAGRA